MSEAHTELVVAFEGELAHLADRKGIPDRTRVKRCTRLLRLAQVVVAHPDVTKPTDGDLVRNLLQQISADLSDYERGVVAAVFRFDPKMDEGLEGRRNDFGMNQHPRMQSGKTVKRRAEELQILPTLARQLAELWARHIVEAPTTPGDTEVDNSVPADEVAEAANAFGKAWHFFRLNFLNVNLLDEEPMCVGDEAETYARLRDFAWMLYHHARLCDLLRQREPMSQGHRLICEEVANQYGPLDEIDASYLRQYGGNRTRPLFEFVDWFAGYSRATITLDKWERYWRLTCICFDWHPHHDPACPFGPLGEVWVERRGTAGLYMTGSLLD